MVLHFDQFLAFAVFFGVSFGFLSSSSRSSASLKTGGGGDGDVLAAAGGLVLRGHFEDAVGVDIEGHFDLRDAARRRGNAIQDELAQGFVIGCHRAFALQDVDLHLGLTIGGGREDLALAGRDGGVAFDDRGGHAAHTFQPKGSAG